MAAGTRTDSKGGVAGRGQSGGSLKQRAYEFIRGGLISSQWGVDGVFSPAEVARRMGMSYTPVREAVLQLESEGLVETVGNRGIRPRVLDRESFAKMFEFRTLVESGAAKLAARRMSSAGLAVLRRNCRRHVQLLKMVRRITSRQGFAMPDGRIVDLPMQEEFHRLNFEFHLEIITATENPQLIKTVGDLHILTTVLRQRVYLTSEEPIQQVTGDFVFHRRIYGAIRDRRDEDARRAMEEHLLNAMEHHLRLLGAIEQANRERMEFSPTLMKDLRGLEDRLPKAEDENA